MQARKKSRFARVRATIESLKPTNIRDFGAMVDPLALIIIFLLSVATGCVGIWQMNTSAPGASRYVFGNIPGSPFLVIATLWAFYNAVAPFLFMHYCWTAGKSFRFSAKWLYFVSSCFIVASFIMLWVIIPREVSSTDALDLALQHLYPNAIPQDTNSNYNFVVGKDMQPVQVPIQPDLSGGLLTSDHVKYTLPMSYSLTMLAWALIQYPKAFAGREVPLRDTLRRGAEYLMRCDLNPDSTDAPMFVAQVGDGALYTVVQDAGFDPITSGKVWTSPWQDPQLVGNASRPVWLMTKDQVGADLLSEAAAALAAVGTVFKTLDPVFSTQAIRKARQVFAFATSQDTRPRSYCDFVPCTANVTVADDIITRQVAGTGNRTAGATVKTSCYYLDWITRTCRIGNSLDACEAASAVSKNVYANRLDCCNVLYSLDPTNTKAQGICAVPEGQWDCYIPRAAQRTCVRSTIDPTTGLGCTGKGLQIFTNQLACCESLTASGVVDPTAGHDATGICAPDKANATCWVPDMGKGTCLEQTGATCGSFGIESSYESSIACCNRLVDLIAPNIQVLGSTQEPLTGVCARLPPPPAAAPAPKTAPGKGTAVAANPAAAAAALGAGAGRLLLDIANFGAAIADPTASNPATGAARLLFDAAAAAGSARSLVDSTASPPPPPPPALNGTVWQLPDFLNVATACADGTCVLQQVQQQKEVALYNSTSVLDDMAWGAAWLYKATGDAAYLGMAERYLTRHYMEDINEETLQRDRSYYVANWNNVAWATNALLAGMTAGAPKYMSRVQTFLRTWVTGNPVQLGSHSHMYGLSKPSVELRNFTDANNGALYIVIPDCIATATYEDDCSDGIDNDCNGQIDRLDPACGLFPVLYTSHNLPFSTAPVLPNAANAAFLAMLYAELDPESASDLRCWALGQATYMLGGTQSVDSSVVGYGNKPPTRVQHRASSCPPQQQPQQYDSYNDTSGTGTAAPCGWDSAFFPDIPNPSLDLVQGALVWGPSDGSDHASTLRQSDDMRVRLEDNVGFTGLLAGLAHEGMNTDDCFLGHGVWQRYVWSRDPV